MIKRELSGIEEMLLTERRRVADFLRRSTRHTLAEIDDTTQDTGDLASASHDRGVLYQLQDAYAVRLRLIEEVLSRIDQDGYGSCEHCGRDIGEARLEAIPWTTACLACQEEMDLRAFSNNVSEQTPFRDRQYDAA